MPLAPGAADVEQMPGDRPAMEVHVEYMLRDSHGLDAGMEDVV
jgi:hypothetical protein